MDLHAVKTGVNGAARRRPEVRHGLLDALLGQLLRHGQRAKLAVAQVHLLRQHATTRDERAVCARADWWARRAHTKLRGCLQRPGARCPLASGAHIGVLAGGGDG